MSELNVLQGKTRAGDGIHSGQKMAKNEGFGKVSKIWFDKCITYDQGMNLLQEDKAKSEDIYATVQEMVPMVDDKGGFCMHHKGEKRNFYPTEHCIGQMSNWAKLGTFFPASLMTVPEKKGKPMFNRDRQDSETLVMAFSNGFRRVEEDKKFLWRTRQDGTLRAMLTEKYAAVSNEWLLESLCKIIPGGMLSHWKGNSDTIWGNILIPDTIREEEDSDYGGMTSVGNSEIGERRINSLPSVFRAICMNGCIWDQEKGTGIRQRHSGEINLEELFLEIKKNLEAQIPLIPIGIDRIIGTKKLAWEGATTEPLYAQVATDFKMTKRQAQEMLKARNTEALATPDLVKTLFGVVNSVTRAGQALSNEEWFKFDGIGGTLASYKANEWDRLTSRAKSMTVKEVESALGIGIAA